MSQSFACRDYDQRFPGSDRDMKLRLPMDLTSRVGVELAPTVAHDTSRGEENMYTPTRRRDSVSESTPKFTPSKRGQAALDALALGYDVQLPECSFALLPRTSVSEQAIASFISTGTQQSEQLPRATSFPDSHQRTDFGPKQHRNRGSDISEPYGKRGARQARSPAPQGRRSSLNDDYTADLSTPQSSAATSTPRSSSRASTSSYQPSTSQYVLESPRHTQRPGDSTYRENVAMNVPTSHTPRSMADICYQSSPVRHHSMAIRQPPSVLVNRPEGQNKADTLLPPASTTYNNEELGRFPGIKLATRSHQTRPSPLQLMTPLPEASSMERSLDAYFSPRSEDYQMNIQQLGGSAQYARIHSGISGTRVSHGQPGVARHQALGSPASGPSGARHSPVDRVPRQPLEGEVFYGDPGPSRPHHHHSSSEPPVPVTSARRNSRPQAGSQRPQLTSSLMVSPLSSYGASSSSGQYTSSKPRLRVHTQSIPGSSTQSLRSAPLPSTSSSSRTTPSFQDDEEAFKVHPERAAVSRMETLLMLSVCRAETQGPKSGGITSYPATDGIVIASAGHDHSGYPGPSPQTGGQIYQTLARPNLLGLSDTKVQGPQEAPRDMGFRPGGVVSSQERSPANRPSRQRSGSMGPSLFPDSPHRPRQYTSPYRHRQRSASVIVQGLSPDAVKKLRMYEQLKNQGKGRPESLRAIVGCTAKYRVYAARPRKNTAHSPIKIPVSPVRIPLPPSPLPTLVVSQKEAPFVDPPVAKALDPPSPRNVPLPLSPPQSPTLCTMANHSAPIVSTLVSSDYFRRYHASQGIESPRPIRTRQNTNCGHVIPTLRLISTPEGIDPHSESDDLQADSAEETQEALESGVTPLNERASLKSEGLKPDPQLERILTPTPPPDFWSPPPHSAVIRTSAPLPLLPPSERIILESYTGGIDFTSGHSYGICSAPSPDVCPALCCQPATTELPPVKSFAGDWRQCMVIELSDEEEEEGEEETTDTDFSELEDEDVDSSQALDTSVIVVEGDLISLHEPKSKSIDDARMGSANPDKSTESRATSKGVVSPGVGSGVNAVEAVQHAIVKLALDNAEACHSQRTLQRRSKRPAAPIRAGSMTAAYPTVNQPFARYSLDSERPRDLNSPHTLPHHYLGATSSAYRTPNAYPHSPNNIALETLRSGLELRVAASASAVEEAVRARSASPGISPQDGHMLGSRPSPGFVLPPRLQRLQGIHSRTTPPISTPRLEVPALPAPRLDISSLQQRRSSYESPFQPASPIATLYHSPLNVPLYPTLPRQHPATPWVQERNHVASNVGNPAVEQVALAARHSNAPEVSASSNRAQLANIVIDDKPIPPPPATAPLSRGHGERKRHTRRSAEAVLSNSQDTKIASMAPKPASPAPEPAPSAGTPTTQSATSSPKPKQKGGKKYWAKRRKNPVQEQTKVDATPVPSISVMPPQPAGHTPAPKKAPASPPKKETVAKPKKDSTPTPKESPSSTSKPKRKYKPPKKHKATKPSASPCSCSRCD
ncbi:hypothetical protein OPQ81_005136 [Rhizoctonia solani]|nr:hypothetical protein OPQ81_005136 [Rhizoctonia solani]